MLVSVVMVILFGHVSHSLNANTLEVLIGSFLIFQWANTSGLFTHRRGYDYCSNIAPRLALLLSQRVDASGMFTYRR